MFLLCQQGVHQVLTVAEIRALELIEGGVKHDELPPRRALENTERACDFESLSAGSNRAFLVLGGHFKTGQ